MSKSANTFISSIYVRYVDQRLTKPAPYVKTIINDDLIR